MSVKGGIIRPKTTGQYKILSIHILYLDMLGICQTPCNFPINVASQYDKHEKNLNIWKS